MLKITKSFMILKHIISFIFKGRSFLIYIIRNEIYKIDFFYFQYNSVLAEHLHNNWLAK